MNTATDESEPLSFIAPKFGNPFENDTTQKTQVVCPIPTTETNFIKCIRPSLGTVTGVVGTLWQKLANELRERNIVDVTSQPEFESFVAGCKLVSEAEYNEYQSLKLGGGLLDRSTHGTVPQASQGNVGGGTPPTGHAHPTASAKLPDVQSGSGKGRGGRGKGQTGQKGSA